MLPMGAIHTDNRLATGPTSPREDGAAGAVTNRAVSRGYYRVNVCHLSYWVGSCNWHGNDGLAL